MPSYLSSTDKDGPIRRGLAERVLRHERAIVLGALGVILAASWGWILTGAGMGMSALETSSLPMALGQQESGAAAAGTDDPAPMPGSMAVMAMPAGWNMGYAVLMFFMWWIMMIAMMTPSAAPTILLCAAVARSTRRRDDVSFSPAVPAAFAAGYLAVWAGFSAAAVTLQWGFESVGLLSPMMLNATNTTFAGAILVLAGLWQLTPVKEACLRHCRGPADWLSRHWRPGRIGAFRMGLGHGSFCLGCCWGMMAVLFFGGIMNLWWIAGLAILVLVEKLAPAGPWVARITGTGLLAWGAWFVATSLG